jgi:glycosyltransferase involved in cell wall biosynthesis
MGRSGIAGVALNQVAIIIPALNEAATIAQVVSRVAEYGTPIVVDDGSTDDTAKLAREAGAQIVQHAQNQGYDGALSSGFAHAAKLGCPYVITIDADGQHNPEQLREYIRLLVEGNDLVLGVRDRHQRISEVIFSIVGRLVWQVKDPLCGMKGYRLHVYQALGHFDSFTSIGTELAIRAVASKVKSVQVAVITRDRLDAPRFARRFSANVTILRALAILLWLQVTGRLRIAGLHAKPASSGAL